MSSEGPTCQVWISVVGSHSSNKSIHGFIRWMLFRTTMSICKIHIFIDITYVVFIRLSVVTVAYFVCNAVFCLWLFFPQGIHLVWVYPANTGFHLWLFGQERGPSRARARTVALGLLFLCVWELALSPLETPGLSIQNVLHLTVHPSRGEKVVGLEEVN